MISKMTSAFTKTPPRLKDASLEGMPLHQKQRELKTNVEIAKAEMTRTNPEGIKADNKGNIKIKNNLGNAKIGDRATYNKACIEYEKANHELNMFNKTNAKGLKDEVNTDAKLRKQDGTGSLPSPRAASIVDAAPSGSMVERSRPNSWEKGDDAAAMGLAPAGGSGSMSLDARAQAGSDTPLDKFGMPKHYTTESGQKIPGYLFPGHETPGSGRPLPSDLTFQQPQNAASHGSMAQPTPTSDSKAYLEKARQDLFGGNRREPDTGI